MASELRAAREIEKTAGERMGKSPERPSAARSLLLAAVIVAATLVAYAPALRSGFIWDDDVCVTENPLIHASDGIYRVWFSKATPDYFPLTSSAFWIEWRLWGDNPLGYHLVNVLLGAAGAILLWRTLLRLRIPGAWLAGLLFALHPVAVASVAWIAELKNTLSLPLFLGSILAWLTFEDVPPLPSIGNSSAVALAKADRQLVRCSFSEGGSAIGNYVLSLSLFLLALLAKTSVVMLPAVLLMCAWWRRGKITGRDWLRVFPFAAVAAAMALVTIWYQYHNAIGATVVRTDSLAARTACAGWAAWFYLYKALLPAKLCSIYPRWSTSASLLAFVPGALFLGMLLLLARFRSDWRRPFLFALGYFLVALLPVLGFLNIYFMRYSLVADQWAYTALIGVVALAAGLLGRLMDRGGGLARRSLGGGGPARRSLGEGGARKVAMAVAAALALACGVLTFRQARIYHDEETLWRDTLEKDPKAWVARGNLAFLLIGKAMAPGENSASRRAEADRYCAEALRELDQAIALNPGYAEAYSYRGNLYAATGRYAEAMSDYDQAIARKPDYAEAYVNRGILRAAAGHYAQAMGDYNQAIARDPDLAEAWFNRGKAYAQTGDNQDALRDLGQAIALKRDYAEAYWVRGNIHAAEKRFAEAVGDYTQAIKINPDYAAAYLNRAVSYYMVKDYVHALADVRAAQRLGGRPNPEFLRLLSEAAGNTP